LLRLSPPGRSDDQHLRRAPHESPTLDPRYALQVFDANIKLTESTYDALGRVTAVWLPNRSKGGGQSANYTYAYSVTSGARSWTSTSTIRGNGVYNTTYTIYDSLLRRCRRSPRTPTAAGS
jgi:hypothetical protein